MDHLHRMLYHARYHAPRHSGLYLGTPLFLLLLAALSSFLDFSIRNNVDAASPFGNRLGPSCPCSS